MNNNLRLALIKCERNMLSHADHREFYGCLTPSELLEIVKLGVDYPVFEGPGLCVVDLAREWKREGRGGQLWFYFKQNKKFLELKESLS